MFIAALFIIARTCKQPRCPSKDGWIKKLWYICTMEYYSAIKRNALESVLTRQMNLEPIIQSEVSQKWKTNIIYYHILLWNLEQWYWWTYLQGSNGDSDTESRLRDTGRGKERVRCIERVSWTYIIICKIAKGNLLYVSGNSNRASVST